MNDRTKKRRDIIMVGFQGVQLVRRDAVTFYFAVRPTGRVANYTSAAGADDERLQVERVRCGLGDVGGGVWRSQPTSAVELLRLQVSDEENDSVDSLKNIFAIRSSCHKTKERRGNEN